MAGLADSPLAGGLPQFDLHIIDSVQAQQRLTGFASDAFTLPLGETGQGESEDHTGSFHPDLINPAEFRHGTAAARILDLSKNAVCLLDRNHRIVLLRAGS
jgi:hypothetical protein